MKIMAIDYGDAHTGIAVSDALLTLAGFTTVITAYRPEAVAAEVQNLIAEHGVTELVLGHPLNMDTHDILMAGGKNAKQRKKTVDAVAASLMLEGYLTFKKRQK